MSFKENYTKDLEETIKEKVEKLDALILENQELDKKSKKLISELIKLDSIITGLKEALKKAYESKEDCAETGETTK